MSSDETCDCVKCAPEKYAQKLIEAAKKTTHDMSSDPQCTDRQKARWQLVSDLMEACAPIVTKFLSESIKTHDNQAAPGVQDMGGALAMFGALVCSRDSPFEYCLMSSAFNETLVSIMGESLERRVLTIDVGSLKSTVTDDLPPETKH